MDRSRREFLPLAAAGLVLLAAPRLASPQRYPARPVKIIVSFPAGGPADIVARLIGQALSDRAGQLFVVENRPGAGGNVAAEAVVASARRWTHAAADGREPLHQRHADRQHALSVAQRLRVRSSPKASVPVTLRAHANAITGQVS